MNKAIERVQTGVRIEKRILKVLKGLAEQLDISLGDLLEGMTLHCFEGKPPFSDANVLRPASSESFKDLCSEADAAEIATNRISTEM